MQVCSSRRVCWVSGCTRPYADDTGGAVVIAGFFTGGALAVRGGVKAARNSAIGCACLLAIIEGVGIGLNRVMAANNMPQNPQVRPPSFLSLGFFFLFVGGGIC